METNQSPILPQPPAGITIHRDLAYVSNGHERQKLDLYLPKEGQNRPLIIWIHGGAFRRGSKESSEHNQLPFDYLTEGYALVRHASVSCRLTIV